MEKIPELVLVNKYWRLKKNGKAWHRVVYRQAFGKPPKGWHVHHIDGNSLNNDPANLIALPEVLHVKAHKQSPLPDRPELERWVRLHGKPVKSKKRQKKGVTDANGRYISFPIAGGMTLREAVEAFPNIQRIPAQRMPDPLPWRAAEPDPKPVKVIRRSNPSIPDWL